MTFRVRRTDAATLMDVRWRELREGRPRETAAMPGDDDPDTRHWGVFDDDDVAVACATVMKQAWPEGDGPVWRLRGMAVDRRLRRQGLGAQLLQAVQADVGAAMWCDARIVALDFYASMGWHVRTPLFEVPNVGPHRRMIHLGPDAGPQTLWEGSYLRVRRSWGWENVVRVKASGVVAIVPLTDDGLVLVEQPRPPLGRTVIELPAGLAGDLEGAEDEAMLTAAKRELLEETGFEATDWVLVTDGPVSSGLTDETVHLYVARGLTRVGPGGGDASEAITVHVVPLGEVLDWLALQRRTGALIDHKVLTGLWLAGVPWHGEEVLP